MTDGSWVWVGKRIARAFYDADLYGQLVREVPRAWITERGEGADCQRPCSNWSAIVIASTIPSMQIQVTQVLGWN